MSIIHDMAFHLGGVPLGGGIEGFGVGNVYWVIQTTASFYTAFSREREGCYNDGSSRVHTTIQSALDACVACRNDYVIVLPSTTNYDVTTTLTMSKANVHLLCPAGIQHSVGSNYAARLQGGGSSDVLSITARGCEVAGFDFRQNTNYGAIYLSGAHGAHIHHNFFGMTGTVASIHAPSGNYKVLIERNHFSTNTSSVTYTEAAAILIENNNNGWCRVTDNFICIGDGCTAAQVIYHYGYKGEVSRNVIFATEATGAGAAGTITTAIAMMGGSGVCTDNRLGVANTADLGGMGTYMAQNNISGGTGGAISG